MARHSGIGRAWSYFWENQVFDLIRGTDTAHWKPQDEAARALPNAEHGLGYEASYTSQVRRALRLVAARAPLSTFDFYDLGCGKGKTPLLAARLGLRSVTGVEYDPRLAAIARANLVRSRVQGRIVEADAGAFTDYGPRSLVYLFNPFDAVVLERAVERIEAAGVECVVVYTYPAHPEPFAHWREIEGLKGPRPHLNTRIWSLGKALEG
jgi:predicted RNA methylase